MENKLNLVTFLKKRQSNFDINRVIEFGYIDSIFSNESFGAVFGPRQYFQNITLLANMLVDCPNIPSIISNVIFNSGNIDLILKKLGSKKDDIMVKMLMLSALSFRIKLLKYKLKWNRQ